MQGKWSFQLSLWFSPNTWRICKRVWFCLTTGLTGGWWGDIQESCMSKSCPMTRNTWFSNFLPWLWCLVGYPEKVSSRFVCLICHGLCFCKLDEMITDDQNRFISMTAGFQVEEVSADEFKGWVWCEAPHKCFQGCMAGFFGCIQRHFLVMYSSISFFIKDQSKHSWKVQYPFHTHTPHVIIQVSKHYLPICGWQD